MWKVLLMLEFNTTSQTLEQIFHDWIDFLVQSGQVKRENINYKLLTQAIVELELQAYLDRGGKLH
jgi:hypothetical protein|tara:strand:- start:1608 stop:1802 length:195 start_codon:yes stop_codon:yes gene_type:complete